MSDNIEKTWRCFDCETENGYDWQDCQDCELDREESLEKEIVDLKKKLQAAEIENKSLERQNNEIQNKFLEAIKIIAFYQDPLSWYPHNQVKYSDICDSDIRHDNRLCQRGGLRAETFIKNLRKQGARSEQ